MPGFDTVRCPVYGNEHCEAHLLATIEDDEGLVGGCLNGEWDSREEHIKGELQDALLAGRANPDWRSEVDGIYHELLARRADLVIPDPDADTDDEAAPIIDEDSFSDAWLDIGAQKVLLSYLDEWLDSLPGILRKAHEIAHSPGLTWSGTAYYAVDPKPIPQRFVDEFCVSEYIPAPVDQKLS